MTHFAAGQVSLSTEQANLLNEIARGYSTYGFKLGVTSWPLTVHRVGRLAGQIIGIDPKAFRDDDTGDGSGPQHQITFVTEICLDGTGGGYVRKKTVDLDTFDTVDEWCEAIPVCGSGADGNLCDDLPGSGSGSGSGSGGGGGPGGTMLSGCCVGQALAATLNLTLSGGNGTVALTWNGTEWLSAETALPCGLSVIFRFTTACELTWSTDGGESFGGTPGGSKTCGPPFSWSMTGIALGGGCGTLTGTLAEA